MQHWWYCSTTTACCEPTVIGMYCTSGYWDARLSFCWPAANESNAASRLPALLRAVPLNNYKKRNRLPCTYLRLLCQPETSACITHKRARGGGVSFNCDTRLLRLPCAHGNLLSCFRNSRVVILHAGIFIHIYIYIHTRTRSAWKMSCLRRLQSSRNA